VKFGEVQPNTRLLHYPHTRRKSFLSPYELAFTQLTVQVSPLRSAPLTTGNIVSFDVELNWGARVIPIYKPEA
jgi:hypothetical protein